LFHDDQGCGKRRVTPSAGSPKPADHPVYAMTIVVAITVVRAKASAMAAKIILIA
jgi:hypothetical protein